MRRASLLFILTACRWSFVETRGTDFVLAGERFVPWGFNYDHDEGGRLIEDYWDAEWAKVEEDFGEMKRLGANVVRVHLQLGKFMDSAETPNAASLDRLEHLLRLAERLGLYLDLTGLGCYHKKSVPEWYDALSEEARWDVQARFWRAVAGRCAGSAAVFCYDLMNEPVAPAGKAADWLGPAFGDKHFVQYVSRDRNERLRSDIARAWIRKLVAAIREKDRRHLITVGLVDWSLDRPGLTSGFVPEKIAVELDFVAVHLYPVRDRLDEALKTLSGFAVGKPVLVEETFPLKCSPRELEEFIERSKEVASGWIGFYWGRTPEELRGSKKLGDVLLLQWLDMFVRKGKK